MPTVISHPDAEKAAAWAESVGVSFKVEALDDGEVHVILSDHPEKFAWAYSGSGEPTKAIHEAMTYPVRDRGFPGGFTERCDRYYCPFCTDTPFPTDKES